MSAVTADINVSVTDAFDETQVGNKINDMSYDMAYIDTKEKPSCRENYSQISPSNYDSTNLGKQSERSV